jgi:hypothetical protein
MPIPSIASPGRGALRWPSAGPTLAPARGQAVLPLACPARRQQIDGRGAGEIFSNPLRLPRLPALVASSSLALLLTRSRPPPPPTPSLLPALRHHRSVALKAIPSRVASLRRRSNEPTLFPFGHATPLLELTLVAIPSFVSSRSFSTPISRLLLAICHGLVFRSKWCSDFVRELN